MRKQLAFDDTPATTSPDDDDDPNLARAFADVGLRLKRKPHPAAAPRRDRDVFHLWREHEPVLVVWGDVQTSWRVGLAGATGIHKGDVERTIRAHGHSGARADRIYLDILVMERAALDEWAKQREAGKQRTWRD